MANLTRKISFYDPDNFGKEERQKLSRFNDQYDDAKEYFFNYMKPRYDRSYALFMSWPETRRGLVMGWQNNIAIPFTNSTVEALMPRIVDARPDFGVVGRSVEDNANAVHLQNIGEYNWDLANMDATNEEVVRSALVYGNSWIQTWWKKEVKTARYYVGKDVNKAGEKGRKAKGKWVEKTVTVYDAPFAEAIDPYTLLYDHRNKTHKSKQYFYRRKLLNEPQIRRDYPMADPLRLELAFKATPESLEDWAAIRTLKKSERPKFMAEGGVDSFGAGRYVTAIDPKLGFHEVKERISEFDGTIAVTINNVPIYDGFDLPIVYNHKETGIIHIPYMKVPFEYEGISLPEQLDGMQTMLNTIKNQRLDAMLLNIHKMWIVNPNANIAKKDLAVRPFGIIWSPDPNGVRPVEFSDVKQSAYQEESLLKADMAYATGVDDASRGVQSGGSATEVRHLREATLERVRLFINHLGDGYSDLHRLWISMWGQFMSKSMAIRVTGSDGQLSWPVISRDDLKGNYDFKSTVKPSSSGRNDVDKKQAMDLFQLLVQFPFIDKRKLLSMTLVPFAYPVDKLVVEGQEAMPADGADGQAPVEQNDLQKYLDESGTSSAISPEAYNAILKELEDRGAQQSPFAAASQPMMLDPNQVPPAAPDTTNPRGMNRSGKVDTNIPTLRGASDTGASILNQAKSIQR
ncbi:MAG: hypothetical protein WC455_10670 [Dehalococcoidia bacterium]|jgi:hypothetical protein